MHEELKTDYLFNEHDFVQHDGKIDELTVTITLNEYRELITLKEKLLSDKAQLSLRIDTVEEKVAEFIQDMSNRYFSLTSQGILKDAAEKFDFIDFKEE